MDIIKQLAEEFKIGKGQVESTVNLIDSDNTIPFIARYRKEATGGLDDVILRNLNERLEYLRGLEKRKEEVKRLIDEQGKLTEELAAEIDNAQIQKRIEDLYKPYKKKKVTRASKAKAKGLEPLAIRFFAQLDKEGDPYEFAESYVNSEKEVKTAEDAVKGACDIIAEMISEDADLIEKIRTETFKRGIIEVEAENPEDKNVYEMYYGRKEKLNRIPNHRILAINRGEKEKKLKVKVDADAENILGLIERNTIRGKSIYTELLKETAEDAYRRLIAPSVEREMRNTLSERAEDEAIRVFAENTASLLMVPPVKEKRIISMDPGFRTGCKVAAIDETGKLLAYTTVFPVEPRKDVKGTEKALKTLIEKYKINVIVIGNGTASRETEEVVSDFITKNNYDLEYTIVNEAGASVYSASKVATEEYPDLDVTTRGAMSLGRRLQDPLAELVKIDPKHIGVGQYQHDMNQKKLDYALGNVVEDCVNRVGVDLNTASPSLLSYIAGINKTVAKNIVKYREENGSFKNRKELKKVPRLGEKAFTQCAGFLRITGGNQVLDSTSVHPESYAAAQKLMKETNITADDILKGGAKNIRARINELYPEKSKKERLKIIAEKINVGEMTLNDIISEFEKPARDPREDAPPVLFRRDVRTIEDLKPDMELQGTVRNVVDFGAFVDIGLKNDGLVHISQMSDRFIKHPMDVVSTGDTVKVKILEIDKEKGRISLTMKL